jgi:SAM-dependent methyltransferase
LKPPSRREIRDLMVMLSGIDYNESLPQTDDSFLKIWSDHYRRIVHLIPENVPARVLEIGVGYGMLSLLLKRHYPFDVTATEHPSRGYLQSAEFMGLLKREGIHVIEHDLNYPLPFTGGSFDMVFCCDVIEHLPAVIVQKSLNEIRRVTKKNGYLVLSTPNLARLPNRLRFLVGKGINPPLNPVKAGDTYDHIREFTCDEIEGLLQGRFRVLRKEYGLISFFNRRFNFLNSLLFLLYSGLGDETYILAQAVNDSG